MHFGNLQCLARFKYSSQWLAFFCNSRPSLKQEPSQNFASSKKAEERTKFKKCYFNKAEKGHYKSFNLCENCGLGKYMHFSVLISTSPHSSCPSVLLPMW